MYFFNLVDIVHISTADGYSLEIDRILSNSFSCNLVSIKNSEEEIKIISPIINIELHVNVVINNDTLEIIALEMSLLCDIQQVTILSKHLSRRDYSCRSVQRLAECIQCGVRQCC